MEYEYKNKHTGTKFTTNRQLTQEEMDELHVKRVWSVGFSIKTVDWSH